ncbi:MAG: GNAT family N-acetyltransferase [Clostridia bacterium]|nr:GNAT family N-acetyltransferase [Clostridia bacterium]
METVAKLFYETIHTINAADYTPEQLNAWAPETEKLKSRRDDLNNQNTLIAEIRGTIVGFGSIDKSGYLDLLFVHKDYQRQGVAAALCDELEKGFSVIKTYASITAKPFFENRGYVTVKAREAECSGVKLRNYEMQKI